MTCTPVYMQGNQQIKNASLIILMKLFWAVLVALPIHEVCFISLCHHHHHYQSSLSLTSFSLLHVCEYTVNSFDVGAFDSP